MIISNKQQKNFKDEGFMIIPDFLSSKELKLVRDVCDACIKDTEERMRKDGITKDRINVLGKKYFINNVHEKYPEINTVIFSEKCAEVCKSTIGPSAFLHNEQFVVKMESDEGTSFAWHQDSGYSVYNGGTEKHDPFVTFWIALDDMSFENGTISVLPFSREPSSRELLEHTWDDNLSAMVGYRGEDAGDLVEVSAGSLVAFSSRLLHKSGANKTNRPRRSYFIAFTPELFYHTNRSKGIYNSGEPLLIDGKAIQKDVL